MSESSTKTLSQSFVAKSSSGDDPAVGFRFWVKLGDTVVAEFKECSGIRLERASEPVEEGGVNDRVTYLPGRSKQSTITLKYGVMNTYDWWWWYQNVLSEGKVERVDMSIYLVHPDTDRTVARHWNLYGAFPVKYEGPALNVESSQVAIETLEIAFNRLELDTMRIGGPLR
jgi:phage tail-like protein